MPRHVAIIMDGNARWAERRRLPPRVGHENGVESLRAVVKCASAAGGLKSSACTGRLSHRELVERTARGGRVVGVIGDDFERRQRKI